MATRCRGKATTSFQDKAKATFFYPLCAEADVVGVGELPFVVLGKSFPANLLSVSESVSASGIKQSASGVTAVDETEIVGNMDNAIAQAVEDPVLTTAFNMQAFNWGAFG